METDVDNGQRLMSTLTGDCFDEFDRQLRTGNRAFMLMNCYPS